MVVNAATPVLMPWLSPRSTRCCGPGCPARRAATRSRPRCSATSSRPAGWSPRSRPPTTASAGLVGHPGRRRAAVRRGHRSSATAATSPAGRPAPAFWLGPRPGLRDLGVQRRAPGRRRRPGGHGDGDQHRRAGPAARSCRSTSSRPSADEPVRLVGWTAVDGRRRASRRRSRSPPTAGCGAGGTPGGRRSVARAGCWSPAAWATSAPRCRSAVRAAGRSARRPATPRPGRARPRPRRRIRRRATSR